MYECANPQPPPPPPCLCTSPRPNAPGGTAAEQGLTVRVEPYVNGIFPGEAEFPQCLIVHCISDRVMIFYCVCCAYGEGWLPTELLSSTPHAFEPPSMTGSVQLTASAWLALSAEGVHSPCGPQNELETHTVLSGGTPFGLFTDSRMWYRWYSVQRGLLSTAECAHYRRH